MQILRATLAMHEQTQCMGREPADGSTQRKIFYRRAWKEICEPGRADERRRESASAGKKSAIGREDPVRTASA